MRRRTIYRATRYVAPARLSRVTASVIVGSLAVVALWLALALAGV